MTADADRGGEQAPLLVVCAVIGMTITFELPRLRIVASIVRVLGMVRRQLTAAPKLPAMASHRRMRCRLDAPQAGQ